MPPRTIVYLAFHARPGGAELYLASLLEALDRSRFTPIVAFGESGPLAARLAAQGVRVETVPMRYLIRGARDPICAARNAAAFARAVTALVRLVRLEDAALLHSVDEPALKYGPVARLTGTRAVATLPDALLPPYGVLHRRAIVWAARHFYDRVVVPSEANRRLAVAAGMGEEHVRTLHTGIDLERFARAREGRDDLRRSLGIEADAPLVGAIGRFDPLKGYDVLVEAMAIVTRSLPRSRCVIVGDAVFDGEAEWKRAVERQIRSRGLEGKIFLTGWRDDIPSCLGALDLLVHPSTRHDSLPTSVLEAMAAGLPVVGSRDGGIPELVEEGVTGWLVPPRDVAALARTLVKALSDPDRLRGCGAAARVRARCFDRRDHAARLAELYEEVLEGSPS
jgi:glycosyltransferase involved in cell wall biosynthesis